MNVLVTGGCGFIGSHIVDRCVLDGHNVTVIDNQSSIVHDNFYFNNSAKYYKLDIADFLVTEKLYKDIDVVFHLAAESRIQPSIENPIIAVQTNCVGTASVLEAAKRHGVKRVVYSSTSSAYGLQKELPLREDMPKDCLNTYSVSKTFGEELCKAYYTMFGLETISFRYFNIYGPREPIRGSYAPVVGLFLRQHRANEDLTIVLDGTQRRDFIHVNDVVEANIKAATVDLEHYGELINIGTGKNTSVLELAGMISDKIKMINSRIGEAQATLADNSKAKKLLNWEPKHSIEEYIKNELQVY